MKKLSAKKAVSPEPKRKSNHKAVLKRIVVPNNDFCCDGVIVCEHFYSYDGRLTCDAGFILNQSRKIGSTFRKPKTCSMLPTETGKWN